MLYHHCSTHWRGASPIPQVKLGNAENCLALGLVLDATRTTHWLDMFGEGAPLAFIITICIVFDVIFSLIIIIRTSQLCACEPAIPAHTCVAPDLSMCVVCNYCPCATGTSHSTALSRHMHAGIHSATVVWCAIVTDTHNTAASSNKHKLVSMANTISPATNCSITVAYTRSCMQDNRDWYNISPCTLKQLNLASCAASKGLSAMASSITMSIKTVNSAGMQLFVNSCKTNMQSYHPSHHSLACYHFADCLQWRCHHTARTYIMYQTST